MNVGGWVVAFICVIALAVGQILFKYSAMSLVRTGQILAVATVAPFLAAAVLYGITSLAWIWVLQKAELGRVYPLMSLTFVLVPLGSHLAFGERLQPQYLLGIVLIALGIVIALRS